MSLIDDKKNILILIKSHNILLYIPRRKAPGEIVFFLLGKTESVFSVRCLKSTKRMALRTKTIYSLVRKVNASTSVRSITGSGSSAVGPG